MKTNIGIIGLGRFGILTAEHVRKYFNVIAYDTREIEKIRGVKFGTLADAASQPIVIIAVPIRKMKNVLKKMAPFVRRGTLICDVCSVKEKPVQWMKEILPGSVSILGTHPLFGPDSISKNFKGNNIALCPVRISKSMFISIKQILVKIGLNVYVLSPEQHDRALAYTQALVHTIARGLYEMPTFNNLPETKSYQKLANVVKSLQNDSKELFEDMTKFNKFAKKARTEFLNKVKNY
jgi:prephenate dehydrogenase